MGVLRFLALLLHWVEALEVISTPVKITACQEARVGEVLEVAHEQVVQALLDRAMRAVQARRGPHMEEAAEAVLVLLAVMLLQVRAVQAAKASLQAAATDKAGHRVKAIGLIDQAIVEVQLGINAAR
jgi:hypothetical protein